jgi:hypothetical protein
MLFCVMSGFRREMCPPFWWWVWVVFVVFVVVVCVLFIVVCFFE